MSDLIEVRVSNLIGAPLDWAVAMAEGFGTDPECRTTIWRTRTDPTSVSIIGAALGFGYRPSSSWEHGGQLIDKHSRTAQHIAGLPDDLHYAGGPAGAGVWCYGPTALIAFCRGLVNHKLGDTVQVPKQVLKIRKLRILRSVQLKFGEAKSGVKLLSTKNRTAIKNPVTAK